MTNSAAQRRRLRRSCLALGAVLISSVLHGELAAQPAGASDVHAFERTPAEDEVWTLYQDNRLITGRRKAEALLEREPDSIVAHFVLGQILREVEGALPQAMRHLGRARELYETRWSEPSRSPAPWILHREILYAIQIVAGELERHDYRLQILEYYNALYDPDLDAEQAWALVQLGRHQEGRRHAEKAASAADPFQRSLGLNAACGIAGQGRDRQAWFEACNLAYEDARQRAKDDSPYARPDEVTNTTVHAYNAALAAIAVLDFERAEQLATAGARRLEFTAANPWRLLVKAHIGQARMHDALNAAREMQRWRRQQPPMLRSQVRADTEATFATLLLVAGETGRGLRVIHRAIAQPDRRGLTTASREQTLGAHALLRRALARTHAEQLLESTRWLGTQKAASSRLAAARAKIEAVRDQQRITAVLSDDDTLVATFELFTQRGIAPVPSWLMGDLIEILGPGRCDVVLEMAREQADFAPLDPYFKALQAEIAWREGELATARALAREAYDALPLVEVLLKARVAAVAAEAASQEAPAEALSWYEHVMDADGGTIRRMGLRLPAEVVARGSQEAERAGAILERSPRLSARKGAFRIIVEGSGDELQACLHTAQGAVLFCVSSDPPPEDDAAEDDAVADDERPARLIAAFHHRAFAMPMALSNIDLGSLDGTSTVATEAARERTHTLLSTLDD